MSTITLNTWTSKTLDRQAMAKERQFTPTPVRAPITVPGARCPPWKNGGFKTIGFIKYKRSTSCTKYRRTQTKVDHYAEKLTVVIG